MALNDVRKRLERLGRLVSGGVLKPASDLSGGESRPALHPPDLSLETLIPGMADETDGAAFYNVERAVAASWKPARKIHATVTQAFRDPSSADRAANLHPDLTGALEAGLEQLLFLDLETCGFAGTPVFLIGAMHWTDGDFRTEQLLARTYSEENAIIARVDRLLAAHPYLVTYNGKSFDWPFLTARAAACRVSLCEPAGHCDLLHIARRRFRDVLPDCRLQTLERFLCGRRREGDIPGSAIPAAYHEFVRSGDARELRTIIHHNFLDLMTLAEVLGILLAL